MKAKLLFVGILALTGARIQTIGQQQFGTLDTKDMPPILQVESSPGIAMSCAHKDTTFEDVSSLQKKGVPNKYIQRFSGTCHSGARLSSSAPAEIREKNQIFAPQNFLANQSMIPQGFMR